MHSPRRKAGAVAVPAHIRHEINRVAAATQLLGQRERREQVSSGAPGGQHDGSIPVHDLAFLPNRMLLSAKRGRFWSGCRPVTPCFQATRRRVRASSIPSVTEIASVEEPPADR